MKIGDTVKIKVWNVIGKVVDIKPKHVTVETPDTLNDDGKVVKHGRVVNLPADSLSVVKEKDEKKEDKKK